MPIHHHVLGALPASTERSFLPIAASARASSAFDNVVVAGATVPLHRHGVEEIIVCLAGVAECRIEDGPAERYQAGSVLVIPPGVAHTIRNVGDGPLHQLSFFAGSGPGTEWIEPAGSVA